MIVLAPTASIGLIPVSLLGLLIGGFPLRKDLFSERWSLLGFLSHTLRIVLIVMGPWLGILALAFLPVSNLLFFSVVVTAVLVSVGWLVLHTGEVAEGVLGATVLDDPHLLPRLEAVLEQSTCERPIIVRAGASGGTWVNAFAVGGRQMRVLLTDGLLELLSPDEVVGIFAHEVAHLEEFGRWRWRVRVLLPVAFAALYGVAVVTLVHGGVVALPLRFGWLLPLIVGGALIGRGSRERETACDERAVEMTQDGAALSRALMKLHDRARIPRRRAARSERRRSHPSLARRLQTIAAASGWEPEAEDFQPVLVHDAKRRGVALAFLPERAAFLSDLDPAATTESPSLQSIERACAAAGKVVFVAYADMIEIRLEPHGSHLRLRTVQKGHRLPRVWVSHEDAAVVQTTLDTIDRKLGFA